MSKQNKHAQNVGTGYLYRIIAEHDDFCENEQYIGCTFYPLYRRLAQHKSDFLQWKLGKLNRRTSFNLFEKYGFEPIKIQLIQSFENVNKKELEQYETKYISSAFCCNKNGRTGIISNNKQEYNQIYSKLNREKINERLRNKRKMIKEQKLLNLIKDPLTLIEETF